VFTEWMRALDGAMRVEGVPSDVAERVMNRVLCGTPDPQRVYRHEPMPSAPATTFLFVWLDTVLGGMAAAGHCPKCREPITAVTIGRRDEQHAPAWFQANPCGCLFEVEASNPFTDAGRASLVRGNQQAIGTRPALER
jgi:hypothetical protein